MINKFICRKCGTTCEASSYEEIVKRKKLYNKCAGTRLEDMKRKKRKKKGDYCK